MATRDSSEAADLATDTLSVACSGEAQKLPKLQTPFRVK